VVDWPSETTVILGGQTWQYQGFARPLLPLRFVLAWPSETTVILGGRTWQYPGLTQVLLPLLPPVLAWPSETTVILGGRTWQYQALARVLLPALPIVLDWLAQLPDPLRRPLHTYYYPPAEIRVSIRRRPPRHEVRLRGFRRRPARF